MKNTLALSIILLGGILIYGGYKDMSFADTIRFFTGRKLVGNEEEEPEIEILPPAAPGSGAPNDKEGLPKPITPGPGGLSS